MSDIYIITDTAGRMNELGKDDLLNYLLHTADDLFMQEIYQDIHPYFFAWNSKLIQLEEPPAVSSCVGKSDTAVLADMMGGLDKGSCVLLLSDGNFDYSPVRRAIAASKLNVIGILVGADASETSMNALTTVGKAQRAENITAAVAKLAAFAGGEE